MVTSDTCHQADVPREPLPADPQTVMHNVMSSVLSRRQFLGLAGLSAANSLIEYDNAAMWNRWPPNNTTLSLVPGSEALLPAAEGWAVAPGFGIQDGRNIARQWAVNLLGEPVAGLGYPNTGIKLSGIRDKLDAYYQTLDSMSVYLHSLGGLMVMSAMRGSRQPFKRIVLNCSPFDADDAKKINQALMVHQLHQWTGYEGGPVGAYVANATVDVYRKGGGNLLSSLLNAVQQTRRQASPRLFVSEINLLCDTDLNQSPRDFYRLIVSGYTQAVFCAPADLSADTTVKDSQAFGKWHAWFDRHGVELGYLRVPHAGHADTIRTASAIVPWLAKTALQATTF